MRTLVTAFGLLVALALAPPHAGAQTPAPAPPAGPSIADGARVRLEYTLTDDAGKVIDTNKGEEPFAYTHGEKQIVPGLESALAGLRAGDTRKVTVKPEDGYGAVDPAAQLEIGRDRVPADIKIGSELVGRAPSGQRQAVRVKEIKATTVVLDLNHPLAGKTLFFDVRILGVEAPAK